MTPETLYEKLKSLQEPKGYFFNPDKEFALLLLTSLLANKNRYGYMACPCRLASDNREKDMDIICPCTYRKPDVEEFGSCFCNLYVSADWIENRIPRDYVPERRPVEKLFSD
ncbi:MAG: ferredoxin:thioredoxin reductase [Deltaproteobacteria bacterium]|nr:ferredoxin:thioredoxin reductase [Deltaproteobacteria bacterium]